MKFLIITFCFLSSYTLTAQEDEVFSVYFKFDKHNLDKKQVEEAIKFVKKLDTTRIETIEIFGYCDDRGKDAYNFKLSTKRATTVKNKLIKNGIKSKIIVTIEGKGRILIEDDWKDNLPKARSKNRRVDLLINYKPVTIEELNIPGVYASIPKKPVVGDRIYLENLLFDRGSSKLPYKAKKELDKIAKQLHRNKKIHFEIQGHVCCTPSYHTEAFDRITKKRELSKNRAFAVYKYLSFRRISKKRMTHKGLGNLQPLKKGAKFDRRVELLITKVEE